MYSSRRGQGSDHSLQSTIAVLPAARGEGVNMTKISAKLAKKIEKAGVYYTANYRYAYRHGGFYRQPIWKAASGRGIVEWDPVEVSNGGEIK